MEVFESKENLGCVKLCLAKGELLPLNVQHQITSAHILHHKVNTRLSLETRMKTKEERMPFSSSSEKDTFFRPRAAVEDPLARFPNDIHESHTHLSTSSLSMINSFFKTLMAYRPFVFFSSASMTFPKLPLPNTARKLKSSSPTFRRGLVGCRTGCCCAGGRCW